MLLVGYRPGMGGEWPDSAYGGSSSGSAEQGPIAAHGTCRSGASSGRWRHTPFQDPFRSATPVEPISV